MSNPTEKDMYEAFGKWLESLRSPNTQIAYRNAFVDLINTSNKTLLTINHKDVVNWVNASIARGLAAKTVCMRSAAVSSFYMFIKRLGIDSIPNPAVDLDRPEDKPVEEIYYLNVDNVKRLLSVIDRNTIIGKRDYAMFLAYIVLGRRNSEIRNLKIGDFKKVGINWYYLWSGKGKVDEEALCPAMVIEAIFDYFKAAGRANLKQTDYVFTQTRGNDYGSPLSIQVVGVILKQYALAAGLDAEKIHVHSLRHTAVMLRLNAGESLEQVSQWIGHSSVSITQNNYVHQQ